MKFKKGDMVKIIRRSLPREVFWARGMDRSIGKVRKIISVGIINIRLDDKYYYPKGAVQKIDTKNEQLLFDFMEQND